MGKKGKKVQAKFLAIRTFIQWDSATNYKKNKKNVDKKRMIVYYRDMRTQDEEKKAALFEATVKLVNEIGFASSSVSKIAKEAGVSASTLYVYYKDKEDLLVSTYIQIKAHMGRTILEDFDDSMPIRDFFKKVWINKYKYITKYPEYNSYIEQFSNSPFYSLVNIKETEKYFAPLVQMAQKGIEQKIIKDVDHNFLSAFFFIPVSFLANPHLVHGKEYSEKDIERAFGMAWDAIRL
jgi:AcrR family transcriptional regulator